MCIYVVSGKRRFVLLNINCIRVCSYCVVVCVILILECGDCGGELVAYFSLGVRNFQSSRVSGSMVVLWPSVGPT